MKFIKGYEGIYSIDKKGNVFSERRNIFIKPFYSKDENGKNKYLRVSLSNRNSKRKFFIHRLVAETYIDKVENKNYVNHIDGDKSNNDVSNLEWCTHSENMIHAIKKSLMPSLIGNKQKRNTSGYVGVTKSGKKWKAQVRVNNKLIYLGLYPTPEEASIVYQNFIKKG